MKQVFFTPGPTQLFPTAQAHMQVGLAEYIPSISHRSPRFQEIFTQMISALKQLFSIPQEYRVVLVSSATEAMERSIENCVEKKSFHFFNGTFSKRFYQSAVDLKKQPDSYEAIHGQAYDMGKVAISEDTEMICFTHNETSTGVSLPMDFVYEINKQHPNCLIAVDIVSSVPYVSVDYKKIDIAFFSIQKGFGLPAGLGVVILSPRALEKAAFLKKKGVTALASYRRFPDMVSYAEKFQTKETPNVFSLYLLGKILDDLNKIGIETIRRGTDEKADLLYAAFKRKKKYSLFVPDILWRSKTVIVAKVEGGSKSVVEKARNNGMIIGTGYAEYKETHIRIANFPAHTKNDVQSLIQIL